MDVQDLEHPGEERDLLAEQAVGHADDASDMQAAASALVLLAELGVEAGQLDWVESTLGEAEAAARSAGDDSVLAHVAIVRGWRLTRAGAVEAALSWCTRAARVAEEAHDHAIAARARALTGHVRSLLGHTDAGRYLRTALDFFETVGDLVEARRTRRWLGATEESTR